MSRRHKHRKLHIRRRSKPGSSPGTIHVDPSSPKPKIRAISFGSEEVVEKEVSDVARLKPLLGQRRVTWINIDGLGDERTIRQLGEMFGLHTLALEDVVNVHQRAKVEEYGEVLYIVTRMVRSADPFHTEQVSIFLGKDFVLTFQEQPGDCFEPIRNRIRQSESRMRQAGPDYLAYRLIDAIIDGYFPVLEQYSNELESLDNEIETEHGDHCFSLIRDVKSELVLARGAIRPHRDAVNALLRDPYPQISEDTRVYLRDCYDHTVQIMDLVEAYRELCADLRDYHLSLISNRMNETMKVLTMIATIFIPLGFIAGLYGMNFNVEASPWNMPELGWPYGYPAVLGVMLVIAFGMVLFFRRRGWLGKKKSP